MTENQFDSSYFNAYRGQNIFHMARGKKPHVFGFWQNRIDKIRQTKYPILEVGCGLGYFLEGIKNVLAVGIDISFDALKESAIVRRKSLINGSAELLPFRSEVFEVVVAFDVIEHLRNPERFASEAFRILRWNGVLIISTPNPNSLGARIKRKKGNWFGDRDQSHINILKMEEWQHIFNLCGFKVHDIGTDTLWDVPYSIIWPRSMEKAIFMTFHWVLSRLFGYFHWNYGENSIFVLRK